MVILLILVFVLLAATVAGLLTLANQLSSTAKLATHRTRSVPARGDAELLRDAVRLLDQLAGSGDSTNLFSLPTKEAEEARRIVSKYYNTPELPSPE